MSQTIESQMNESKLYMDRALARLKDELSKISTGKANPSLVNSLLVEYYGNPTQLSQVANISTPDSKTISIQPWEKSMLAPIEQAIFAANLGLTPMNDGEFVRIMIPALTEERRKQLAKQAKALGEDAKVSLRNSRHKVMDFIRKEVKEGYPEDAGKKREAETDNMVKQYATSIDEMVTGKEKEIMTV